MTQSLTLTWLSQSFMIRWLGLTLVESDIDKSRSPRWATDWVSQPVNEWVTLTERLGRWDWGLNLRTEEWDWGGVRSRPIVFTQSLMIDWVWLWVWLWVVSENDSPTSDSNCQSQMIRSRTDYLTLRPTMLRVSDSVGEAKYFSFAFYTKSFYQQKKIKNPTLINSPLFYFWLRKLSGSH